MQVHTSFYYQNGWQGLNESPLAGASYQLVLAFADRELLEDAAIIGSLCAAFPNAKVVSCSTAGEISGRKVYDGSLVAISIHFEQTPIKLGRANIRDFANSYDLGRSVAAQLPQEDLKYALVISDGNKINGSELISAINEELGRKILVTGGMAGDRDRFSKTLVGINEEVEEGTVALIGFYGDHIKIGYGLNGGWEVFGPERIITRSENNVLHEIDDQNALDLYKKYLGKYASELPGSALLFPLAVKYNEESTTVVRTILKIDEAEKSMTFAGDVPEGSAIRLMKANFDKLIYSAGEAAGQANAPTEDFVPQLALLISCVGRKLVLGRKTEEEVEAAGDSFGDHPVVAGFYSYGEFSPVLNSFDCELHNQTMTITTFAEA